MVWLNIDDTWGDDPRTIAVGNAAAGLYARAGTYCTKHLTDGFIPDATAKSYGTRGEIKRLVDAGYWERDATAGGYWITDYEVINKHAMRARVERERAAARNRMDKIRRNGRTATPPVKHSKTRDVRANEQANTPPPPPTFRPESEPNSGRKTTPIEPENQPGNATFSDTVAEAIPLVDAGSAEPEGEMFARTNGERSPDVRRPIAISITRDLDADRPVSNAPEALRPFPIRDPQHPHRWDASCNACVEFSDELIAWLAVAEETARSLKHQLGAHRPPARCLKHQSAAGFVPKCIRCEDMRGRAEAYDADLATLQQLGTLTETARRQLCPDLCDDHGWRRPPAHVEAAAPPSAFGGGDVPAVKCDHNPTTMPASWARLLADHRARTATDGGDTAHA